MKEIIDEDGFLKNDKYSEFIEDFENNWLQYSTSKEKIRTYFGTIENAHNLFKKWQNGEDFWEMRKKLMWFLDNKKNQN